VIIKNNEDETSESPIIEFRNVSFSYSETECLYKELSFSLKTGAFYLIKGPSGVGKSTLLRLMNKMEEPTTGDIFLSGEPYASQFSPELRTSVIYIQQIPVLLDCTIKENLLLPFKLKANRHLTKPEDEILENYLTEFNLEKIRLDRNARQLSAGQAQRLCLIRGLLLSPRVILFDEPVSALDKESSDIVEAYAEKLCLERGVTVVMVSHKDFIPDQVEPCVIEVSQHGVSFSTR